MTVLPWCEPTPEPKKSTTVVDSTALCPHCKCTFGYEIDGRFWPVASHIHKVPDGVKRAFLAPWTKR